LLIIMVTIKLKLFGIAVSSALLHWVHDKRLWQEL
jgi:hypothetical protein